MANQFLVPADDSGRCTRRHAIKIFAACTGGVVLGGPVTRALADLPWGETPPARLLAAGDGVALGMQEAYGKSPRQMHPALTLDAAGERLWTAWTAYQEDREAVLMRSFSTADESWTSTVVLSDLTADAAACEPEVVAVGGRLLVVWSQYEAGGWTLLVRSVDPVSGEPGDVRRIAGGAGVSEIHVNPALAASAGRAIVIWQARRADDRNFAVLACLLGPDGEALGEVIDIAVEPEHDCCRPAVAASPDGREFAVAFDRQDAPGTQNVYLVTVDARSGRVSDRQAVTGHPASDLAPALAYSPDGQWLWCAWHSNRRGEDGWDIPRWYRLAALHTGGEGWFVPADGTGQPDEEARGTVQGFELVRLAVSPAGVVCVLGRASHNFCVRYHSREEGPSRECLYRLPKDGWGGRGRLLQGVFDRRGSLWVARRDLGTNVMARIDGFADLAGPPKLVPMEQRGRRVVRRLAGVSPRYDWPEPEGKPADLRLCFGDIHGHSWQSDGMGDPAESFVRARDVFGDDFHALTDHDYFVGKRLNDAQWQQQKDLVEHYDKPGAFVTLFGQEWTTARTTNPVGWGHFNVYTADPTIPLFDHTDDRWRYLPNLYTALRDYDAIAIPHHIGWTGVRWEAINPALTPVVEICSVHGAFEYEGNEPIRHRGGLSGCFYRDGLAAGLRVGVVGGSDQHGLIHHHGVCWKRDAYRAGLTGAWVADLTREGVLDAIRMRRTFATTGLKLQLFFAVAETLMGGMVEVGAPPWLQVDVSVPADQGQLAWLEVVRDGEVIHRYGGEGQRSRYAFTDESCPTGRISSYYLRVTLADHNMAWSSPVWVHRA